MSRLYNDAGTTFAGRPSKRALTAFFDSRAEAEAVIERLNKAGVTDVRLMPGDEAGEDRSAGDDRGGFWSKLDDWLVPDDDRTIYAEGLRRGGFLISASVDDIADNPAHDILDDEGAIDMDERADVWRTDGWVAGDQQAAGARDDVFQAEAAMGSATGVGRYTRSTEATSPRVRAYELNEELPADVVDDVLPTGHQRDVGEGDRHFDDGMTQSQELDDLRQKQSFPGGR